MDGADVWVLAWDGHFEDLKFLKSNASLHYTLGSSVTDGLVEKVVHYLQSDPGYALVLISQRVEN